MIIKQADDKRSQQTALNALLNHPSADAATKKSIEQELRNIQAGQRGEDEAAYEMKVHYGDSASWMVIHDLRIEHCGLVAQIDHLIINRWLEMWVCESKHFHEGVAINEHGEFSAFHRSKPYGVPSPIEQNNRHILILKRVFDAGAVKLPTRLGLTIKPDLKSLVLVSKGARISRPKSNMDGLDCIVKNDLLYKKIDKSIDESSSLVMAKVVGKETLKNLAIEIAKLHKPVEFNWNAKFRLSPQPQPMVEKHDFLSARAQNANAPYPEKTQPPTQSAELADEAMPRKKLVCISCGETVSYNVAKFCWFNKPRFGGNIYCMECQKKV